jgi:crotonobetainyl-CoA:carnitine CoA-transferase CaiB-like acyl-CoA transferase
MPLSHLRVLDLTHYRAGPYCTRLFAGFGADVIKIERPGLGDPLRRCGPYLDNKVDLERSIPFHWLNGGKRSLQLDLKVEEGRAILLELAGQADVLVENFSPGVMQRLNLGLESLQEVNPRLVVTSITNFGASGPYKDYRADETVLYAMSGGMVATGDADKPPLAPGPAVTQYTAGLHAFVGTLIALFRREMDDKAPPVEVSIQESALENVEIHLAEFAHDRKVARRNSDTHPLVPWQCHPCKDGYAAVIGGPLRHWPRAARALFGESGLGAKDFDHVGERIARRKEVEDLVRGWLESRDKVDVYHAGQKLGLAFGYLATLSDALDWQQHRARQFFRQSETHPDVGTLTSPGPLFRIDHTDWNMGRAPRLGEHTSEILEQWLQLEEADLAPLTASGAI